PVVPDGQPQGARPRPVDALSDPAPAAADPAAPPAGDADSRALPHRRTLRRLDAAGPTRRILRQRGSPPDAALAPIGQGRTPPAGPDDLSPTSPRASDAARPQPAGQLQGFVP